MRETRNLKPNFLKRGNITAETFPSEFHGTSKSNYTLLKCEMLTVWVAVSLIQKRNQIKRALQAKHERYRIIPPKRRNKNIILHILSTSFHPQVPLRDHSLTVEMQQPLGWKPDNLCQPATL